MNNTALCHIEMKKAHQGPFYVWRPQGYIALTIASNNNIIQRVRQISLCVPANILAVDVDMQLQSPVSPHLPLDISHHKENDVTNNVGYGANKDAMHLGAVRSDQVLLGSLAENHHPNQAIQS
jgi:hypothetical protein